MNIKPFGIGFIGLVIFAANSWAAGAVLQGTVNDGKGRPIQGAEIRVETKDGGKSLAMLKTDVNGRYALQGLPSGNYRVTMVVNGVVKSSINNTRVGSGATTELNFNLTPTPAWRTSVTQKKGRHWVWIPPFTGSRLPGHWVEVDDTGAWAAEASGSNIVRISAEELQRTIASVDIKRGQ